MTEKPNPDDARKAAVLASKERLAAEARAKAELEAAERDTTKVLEQNRERWPSMVYDVVHRGVMASAEGFARQGSDYVIPPRPNPGKGTAVTYEIRPSGSLNAVATLTFDMDANTDGTVRPSTSAGGCEPFPAPVRLADVTSEWAEQVTDVVMIAVLRGQRR
jgi:hypothetical protein